MQSHPHGGLSLQPDHMGETLFEIVSRLITLGESVAKLDGKGDEGFAPLRPILDLLSGMPRQDLHWPNVPDMTWKQLGSVVTSILAIEARLTALDNKVYPASLLDDLAVQIAMYPFRLHFNSQIVPDLLKLLVGRVIADEARITSAK